MTSSVLLICGFTTLLVVALWHYHRAASRALFFPVFWGVLLAFSLNVPLLFFYVVTGSSALFEGMHPDYVVVGAGLNFLFVLCWIAGYLTTSRHFNFSEVSGRNYFSERLAAVPLLLLSFAFYVYVSTEHGSYAWAQQLYIEGVEDQTTGIQTGLKAMFLPLLAAFVVSYYFDSRENGRSYMRLLGTVSWPLLIYYSLIFFGVTGLLIWFQRGKLLEAILLFLFVGVIIKFIQRPVVWVLVVGLSILVISPVLDYIRTASSSGLSDVEEAMSNARIRGVEGGGGYAESLVAIAASKSPLPTVAGALYSVAERKGQVGFSTYPSVVLDMIPRVLYKDKPYPLSADGTPHGRPVVFVGEMLYHFGTTVWNSGAGVMYWQFGLLGVVIGGGLVGALWGTLVSWCLAKKSLFGFALLFSSLHWGLQFLESLDFVLHEFLSRLRLIIPFVLFSYFIYVRKPKMSHLV